MGNDTVFKAIEDWVIAQLLAPVSKCTVQLEADVKQRLNGLPAARLRKLVSRALDKFLRASRNERNRHVLEYLIESVDDINQCPSIGVESLLQRVIAVPSKPDFGLAKALIRAGHSLSVAPPGGISPLMALELLYGRPWYDKVAMLFKSKGPSLHVRSNPTQRITL